MKKNFKNTYLRKKEIRKNAKKKRQIRSFEDEEQRFSHTFTFELFSSVSVSTYMKKKVQLEYQSINQSIYLWTSFNF
ncbi:hypothetical protein TTHERM_000439148 (macronuclear) [Tetrahymena thermophila SB210]|uniref:Uncharacterized protein n=1 Tax=Tetrahymena thermophila (strain SB210) TaxID=312017 RepID=W7XHQ0_TETTS|nr:hypothetical protein TTHERM_000439148 [Tetrahymena thermophila SB210]EWS73961.1 hypothetical protein TTHERM_000439148 [Tetrahymena thermophila SB210]|eukprot:XP_012653502.1 hypothetical protein TTHERM_000439148 [Tetrahymena thermophila SB210]